MSRAGLRHLAAGAMLGAALLLYAGLLVSDDVLLPARSTDQLNIGLMLLKNQEPGLFPRDPAFADDSLFRFYTPAFLRLMGWLTGLAGGFDDALRLLLPALVLLYAAGMYVLLFDLTGSASIAAAVTAASSLLHRCLGSEFWGVASMKAVLPRSVFLTLVPWLALALLRWRRGGPAWLLPLTGLLTGLAANVHPVSGLCLTQILLTVALMSRRPTRRHLATIALTGALALAGAAPMTWHFVHETGGAAVPTFSVEAFRAELQSSHRTFFPFGKSQAAMGALALACLASLALWVAAAVRRRALALDGSRLLACGVCLALPGAAAITLFRCWPLLLLAGAQAWIWWSRRDADASDRAIGALLAAAVAWGLIAPWLLDRVWVASGRWELAPLVGEQGRAGRFVLLPLFLLAARAGMRVTRAWPAPRRAVAAAALGVVLAAPSLREWHAQRRDALERIEARRDLFAAAEWARERTPSSSLFFTGELEFRMRAQRSITHCWKDLGLSYYSRDRFMEFRDRFRDMEAARGNPARLAELARTRGIDYVLEERDRPLPFPALYANAHYVVYAPSAPGGRRAAGLRP